MAEPKIYHLPSWIPTLDGLDIADPSSMQDACYNEPSKYDIASSVVTS